MDRRQQMASAAERYRGMGAGPQGAEATAEGRGDPSGGHARAGSGPGHALAQAGQLQPEALVKAIAPSESAGDVKQGSLLTWKGCR